MLFEALEVPVCADGSYLPGLGDLGLADSISAFLQFPTVQVLSALLDSSPANQIAVTATDTQEDTCSIRLADFYSTGIGMVIERRA